MSTVVRSSLESAWACCGITVLTPCRIALVRTARARPGSDDEPSGAATSQATISSATTETRAPPTSSTRLAGAVVDAAAQADADPVGERLAEQREAEDGHERDDEARHLGHELAGDQRAELQADGGAAEEADEGQQTNHEALPVPVDRENRDEEYQHKVDEAAGHPFRVRGEFQNRRRVRARPFDTENVTEAAPAARSSPTAGPSRPGRAARSGCRR